MLIGYTGQNINLVVQYASFVC